MTTELKTQLQTSNVRVEFTKADGSNRVMLCTRNFEHIPGDQLPKGTGKKLNETVISVFDLEKLSWRSIKIDSIKNWEVVFHDQS